MSIKIVCNECGRVIYSAAAQSLLDSGYRCACGATPRIEPPEAARPAKGDDPPEGERPPESEGNGLPGP